MNASVLHPNISKNIPAGPNMSGQRKKLAKSSTNLQKNIPKLQKTSRERVDPYCVRGLWWTTLGKAFWSKRFGLFFLVMKGVIKGPGKGKWVPPGKGYGKFGKGKGWPMMDPEKQAAMAQQKKERQDAFTAKLIRAIKQGVKRAGNSLPLAQCGAIAEVANLRKDPEWEKDMKAISLAKSFDLKQ